MLLQRKRNLVQTIMGRRKSVMLVSVVRGRKRMELNPHFRMILVVVKWVAGLEETMMSRAFKNDGIYY